MEKWWFAVDISTFGFHVFRVHAQFHILAGALLMVTNDMCYERREIRRVAGKHKRPEKSKLTIQGDAGYGAG